MMFCEAFDMLRSAGLLDPALSDRLKKMVGFHNVAIHEYQKLNLDIVRRIVVDHLDDFLEFARLLLTRGPAIPEHSAGSRSAGPAAHTTPSAIQ